ncbi:TPA: hypothetical protein ACMD08_004519 [Vibrio parahaemolyticus]|uniref:hypothetical protein n=1 Tax=Vibrio TaxID=662 RepID=UPI001120639E|nr:hypothetical protein [Vibrio parahaemolyticus]EHY0932066.1 hypothetical protein [Vibrio parahaemolyticus]EJC6831969.1 hypothetical protein [Vibrio parahaemolyticus]ELA9595944.1 hypothetical protein [Vibrio parahaemolyticus]TOH94212.1 hypothetical protein CGI70_22135 [Vibrio parahaemolyticus]TOJ61690.1 hypothetical protein CGI35_15375 [Vibrio parahaemolyticus]
MDNCESLVLEYLRADRSVFVNTQCCIQLFDSPNPDKSGPHWYCDLVAVNFKEKQVYLCEVTYSKSLASLLDRFASWDKHWCDLKAALVRDCGLPVDWEVIPWAFIPEHLKEKYEKKLLTTMTNNMPYPKLTTLESILPWHYRSWDRTRG